MRTGLWRDGLTRDRDLGQSLVAELDDNKKLNTNLLLLGIIKAGALKIEHI